MLTLDTSGIVALADRLERHHRQALAALRADRGPYLVPAGILAEAGYLLQTRFGAGAVASFVQSLEAGDLVLDCGESDFPRIRALLERYANLSLGLSDASVVACAERNGGTVLTIDRRDFDVVAGEGAIRIVP